MKSPILQVKTTYFAALLTVCALNLPAVHANEMRGEQCKGTILNLSAEAKSSVKNDTATFLWQVVFEDTEPSNALNKVSEVIDKAVKALKRQNEGTKVQTNYQSYPISNKDRAISHWRVSGQISYEIKLDELTNQRPLKFPDTLVLQRISYSLSETEKQQYAEQLMTEALKSFSDRAEIAASALNASVERIIELNVQETGGRYQQPMFRAMSAEMAAPSSAVTAEGGNSELGVQASGRVCLK